MDRKKDLIGMKLYETKRKLRQASRNVVENFKMNGTTYDIIFNNADQKVLEEEKKINQVGEDLKLRYGNIVEITEKDLIDSWL